MDLHASPNQLRPIVEVALDPAGAIEHKGFAARGALMTMRGKRNVVQLGVSDPTPLLDNWPAGERLDAEIEAQRDRWDFAALRLACSYVPDRACRFVWGRLVADLWVANGDTDEPPVAFDLFPREILEKRTFKRTYSVTPKLTLAFADVGASAGSEQEVVRYECRLAGSGLLTNQPIWDFQALDPAGLVGSHELFLVLKKPKGSSVAAKFTVSADVTTRLGRVRLRRYHDPDLVERSYVLAE